MKNIKFAVITLIVVIGLIMTPKLAASISQRHETSDNNEKGISIENTLITYNPKKSLNEIQQLLAKLTNIPIDASCSRQKQTIQKLKVELELTSDKKKNCQTKLEVADSDLLYIQKQLKKESQRLAECMDEKDCRKCQTQCPAKTCPQIICQCEICPEPKICDCKCKPIPCSNCQQSICPQINCPPQIVCPTYEPEICICQTCSKLICPVPDPCPKAKCPEPKPCPIDENCKPNCQIQINQISSLTQQKQTLSSEYNQLLKQRDNCLQNDSGAQCQQQLNDFNILLNTDITEIIYKIEEVFLSKDQKINFQSTKQLLDQIKTQIKSNDYNSWQQTLSAYRRISIKLLTQLDYVSSLTFQTLQLNNQYSDELKSIRNKLAQCQQLLK